MKFFIYVYKRWSKLIKSNSQSPKTLLVFTWNRISGEFINWILIILFFSLNKNWLFNYSIMFLRNISFIFISWTSTVSATVDIEALVIYRGKIWYHINFYFKFLEGIFLYKLLRMEINRCIMTKILKKLIWKKLLKQPWRIKVCVCVCVCVCKLLRACTL